MGGICGIFGARGEGVNGGDICPRRGCGDDTCIGDTSIGPKFGGEL